jgi:glycosyltransferase involved in cell wall biosynthesis
MQDQISIVIISYNQENYIRDAVLSALNQDFNNFEIVISDDCSTDNTWAVINDTIKNEKISKSIKIILHQNETNLGIVRNYQKALSLSSGNWIVGMAGDDISKPNRLKVINDLILTHKNIYAIGTGYDLINANGKFISKNNRCITNTINLPLYPGFSAAINRATYTKFPEISENIQSEDIIFSLRAFELGEILLTNISTVKHRIHSQNVTSKGTSIEAYHGKILNHENAIKTLEYYKSKELKSQNVIPVIDTQIEKFKEIIEHYKFIIAYYKENFGGKIFNLSKINPPVKRGRYYTLFYRFKIFVEYYGDFSMLEQLLKKVFYKFKSISNRTKETQSSLSISKLYKL